MTLDTLEALYRQCALCPRACGVDRSKGEKGFCGEGARARLAFVGLHGGEEPPLIGVKGSGTVFFSGCTLKCAFCQNHQISQGGMGAELSDEGLAELFLKLEASGAANVNLVTGTQFIPSIAIALRIAKERGLRVPVLWNSSGYELPEALDVLGNLIDVWLPDLKTLSKETASAFYGAHDYPERSAEAIRWMVARGKPQIEAGAMLAGTMVRHLALPGHLAESRAVLEFFAREFNGKALLSLMSQYTPIDAMPGAKERGAPDRYVDEAELDELVVMLDELGIDDGFCQELLPGSDWLPDFSRANPFPSALSKPVWHWRASEPFNP